jgi:quercetin dioxygenase-like cupin family protein
MALVPGGSTLTHVTIQNAAEAVEIQAGAVVSKVIHRDDDIDVTVFGFDAGEGLTEHTAARPAIVQVLSGRLRFTIEGEDVEMTPCSWVSMSPGAAHSLSAAEPTIMLLTLLRSG